MTAQLLRTYIQDLEKQATPGPNDVRHMSYVKYINAFLSVFGKERVYLVGSTGENLKLRTSKDGGDADFLLCSGRLEIPIDNIEERQAFPCYVNIRADNLRPDVCGDLTDGYLSADILRKVSPKLFTILRAIYTETTATIDTIPGRESRVTTLGVPMKVGLARTEFRNLKVEGGILSPRTSNKRLKLDRGDEVKARLKKRWRDVQINMSDMHMLHRILKIIRMAKVPGSNGENYGQINYFADLLDNVLKRIPLEQEDDDDGDAPTDNDPENDMDMQQISESGAEKKIRGTYSDKTSKDFVPALKIIGDRKLRCMVEWKKRVEKANWPPRNIVDEIFNTDVFVVARNAPRNPYRGKDFCLSFNLAEMKLGQCLSTVQRRVYLILKSYLSGIFKNRHMALDRKMNREMNPEMKLKTYYLKTTFFWVCERENPAMWTEGTTIDAVKTVLRFLLQCVREKKLSHYFVNSNLFAELDNEDCETLQIWIVEVLNNPVHSIGEFKFIKDEDKVERWEIWLTAEEVSCLTELKEDGGRLQHLDKLEDEVIDMYRGFNDGPRDAHGRAPIKEAILKAFDIFLEEERQKQITNGASNMSLGGTATGNTLQSVPIGNVSQATAIAGLFSNFVTSFGRQSMNSPDASNRMDCLLGLGSKIPGVSEYIADIGGRDGVQTVLEQSTSQDTDHTAELRTAIDRYLSCSDEEEDSVSLELKHKLTAYFIGRRE